MKRPTGKESSGGVLGQASVTQKASSRASVRAGQELLLARPQGVPQGLNPPEEASLVLRAGKATFTDELHKLELPSPDFVSEGRRDCDPCSQTKQGPATAGNSDSRGSQGIKSERKARFGGRAYSRGHCVHCSVLSLGTPG